MKLLADPLPDDMMNLAVRSSISREVPRERRTDDGRPSLRGRDMLHNWLIAALLLLFLYRLVLMVLASRGWKMTVNIAGPILLKVVRPRVRWFRRLLFVSMVSLLVFFFFHVVIDSPNGAPIGFPICFILYATFALLGSYGVGPAAGTVEVRQNGVVTSNSEYYRWEKVKSFRRDPKTPAKFTVQLSGYGFVCWRIERRQVEPLIHIFGEHGVERKDSTRTGDIAVPTGT